MGMKMDGGSEKATELLDLGKGVIGRSTPVPASSDSENIDDRDKKSTSVYLPDEAFEALE